jgi:hypothetical protein
VIIFQLKRGKPRSPADELISTLSPPSAPIRAIATIAITPTQAPRRIAIMPRAIPLGDQAKIIARERIYSTPRAWQIVLLLLLALGTRIS